MNHRVFWRTLFASVFISLVACGPTEQPPVTEPTIGANTVELRVMSFNIEWGGALISFANVAEAIRLSGADVVGIQEAEGNLARLAADLGWHYNLRNYAISRFPLIEPPGADGRYVYAEVLPGKIVALANVHLPSDPYGPDLARDGGKLEDVLALERAVRLPKITPYLDVLPTLIAAGVPVFLTGDFNAPAHSDWTAEMVGSRPFLDYAVSWPVSTAVAAAGFKDSWRVAHPNPLTNPGLTWWAARPPLEAYTPGENDAQDRIDFLWFAGPATVHTSEIVGEVDGPEVSFSVDPWPSDHRALVSSFTVEPATMPELVAMDRRVIQRGNDIKVVYNTTDEANLEIQQIAADGSTSVAEQLVNGRGNAGFASDELPAGHYRAVLHNSEQDMLHADFWVREADAVATVTVAGSRFKVGEAIPVSWSNGPGNRNDYLAAYKLDVPVDYENGQAWMYVHALPEGRAQLDQSTVEWSWPLEPGSYVIRLVKDDGYEALAESASFIVE